MIFINGYPQIQGADDAEDSSHLAGILAITEHPMAVRCLKYIFTGLPPEWSFRKNRLTKYMRCPDSKYDFSRDQAIMLMAGLIKQGHNRYVDLDFINGRDVLPPSVRGMVRIAQGKEPYWFQKLWLKAEIYWHSYVQPLDEPNQIIALCSVYGDEYLKLWTSKNKLWKWSVRRYWGALDCEWRQEKELGEHIIKYVESKTLV